MSEEDEWSREAYKADLDVMHRGFKALMIILAEELDEETYERIRERHMEFIKTMLDKLKVTIEDD